MILQSFKHKRLILSKRCVYIILMKEPFVVRFCLFVSFARLLVGLCILHLFVCLFVCVFVYLPGRPGSPASPWSPLLPVFPFNPGNPLKRRIYVK